MDYEQFTEEVWAHYCQHMRSMPWRDDPSLYNVLVSELMLQQTQVPRVLTKFAEFMSVFPTIESLASASLADVLIVWQGLGYNRRAKYLHEAAKYIVANGQPTDIEGLVKLPGVGKNTAGAIMAYVYNQPVAYIETNIRTVYFHHFYPNDANVSDARLLELVAATVDKEHPREWYWALMDYGAFLKSQGMGRLDVSKHYKKQSALKGSVREVRGQILRALVSGDMTLADLKATLDADGRFTPAFDGLLADGLIEHNDGQVHLTK